jgi:opacity protein-like surface antigen
MKKTLLLATLAVFATAAYADDAPTVKPRGGQSGEFNAGQPGGGFMDKLTDDQKACIESKNCPKPEMKEGEKPDKDAMESIRECQKKAFEECGIQMPERQGKRGERPQPQQ